MRPEAALHKRIKKQPMPLETQETKAVKALCGTTLIDALWTPTLQASNKALRCNGRTRLCLHSARNAPFGRLLREDFASEAFTASHQPAALWKRGFRA
jgi:hypothetical protein